MLLTIFVFAVLASLQNKEVSSRLGDRRNAITRTPAGIGLPGTGQREEGTVLSVVPFTNGLIKTHSEGRLSLGAILEVLVRVGFDWGTESCHDQMFALEKKSDELTMQFDSKVD